jgi:hypothetical protein
MATERLSCPHRRILAWLVAEAQRSRGGTMSASHEDLVRAMALDKGNLRTSFKGLEAITPTPGGRAEAVDLTRERPNRVASLTDSCE